MIKFQGEISQDISEIIIKKIKLMLFLCALFSCLLVSIPFIIISIKKDTTFLIMVAYLMFIPFIILLIKNKHYKNLLPNEIIIFDNSIISKGLKFKYTKAIYNILKIVDYGKFYQFIFKFPYKSQNFICQKDLIVEGTLSEFEEKFKDYIVRKDI